MWKKLIILACLLMVPLTCSAEWRVMTEEPEYRMAISTTDIVKLDKSVYSVEEVWVLKGNALEAEKEASGLSDIGAKAVKTFYDVDKSLYRNYRIVYYDKAGNRAGEFEPMENEWTELDEVSKNVLETIKEVKKLN